MFPQNRTKQKTFVLRVAGCIGLTYGPLVLWIDNHGQMEATVAGIQVTPEQLSTVSTQLTNGAHTIDGTLAQLAGQVAPLGSEWQGVAQQRFEQLWQEWQRSAKGLHEALTGIAQLTMQASHSYESTEQGIARSFGS
jgi:6 kDa early secretory antigenic target